MVQADQAVVKIVNVWLKGMGERLGCDLSLDDDHRCFLQLDDTFDTMIKLSESQASIHLVALIGDIPYSQDPHVMETLMAYNFESQHLYGCAIGLCRSLSRYTLSTHMAVAELDGPSFFNAVANFAMSLSKMHEEIQALTQRGGEAHLGSQYPGAQYSGSSGAMDGRTDPNDQTMVFKP